LVKEQLQSESYKIFLEEKTKKVEMLMASLNAKSNEHEIELPQFEVEELKKTLKLADILTMNMIIHYLKSDIYHLIKNTAKTINKSNYAEESIYMD
jgi:2-polyprenyl-3-methyl-5-hydroxy-6-metoxy-1,4-benzoquinol methylase